MSNEKQWRHWADECGECGGDAEILTDQTEEGWADDGDALRCTDVGCGATGSVCVMDEDWVISNWRDKNA
jgi:hypothetical protein